MINNIINDITLISAINLFVLIEKGLKRDVMGFGDSIGDRVSQIILKLNNGEYLRLEELAKEFNVSERTIYRDINERLMHLPVKRDNGRYFLDKKELGQYSYNDFVRFAQYIGLNNILPMFPPDVLNFVIKNCNKNIFKIQGMEKETYFGKSENKDIFLNISSYILDEVPCDVYTITDSYQNLELISLYFKDNKWYLEALNGEECLFIELFSIKKVNKSSKL